MVSTASLVIGVAASGAGRSAVLVAGIAGLVAGAMSMAAGEYVSVSSQADTERADMDRELAELAGFYVARGLEPALAREVAVSLTEHDALGAHAREELGISDAMAARPVQAALTSAGMFSVGAALPLLAAGLASGAAQIFLVASTALVFLAVLGVVGARAGGAPVAVAAFRVTFWGALAMAVTAAIGRLFGAVV